MQHHDVWTTTQSTAEDHRTIDSDVLWQRGWLVGIAHRSARWRRDRLHGRRYAPRQAEPWSVFAMLSEMEIGSAATLAERRGEFYPVTVSQHHDLHDVSGLVSP